MAREYGKLRKSRWRNADWLKLSTDCQWLYTYLLSQPNTDTAGVFPIQLTKWAKATPDMTVERIKVAAKQLADADWIVPDHDTEEGLIRTYVADDEAGGLIFSRTQPRPASTVTTTAAPTPRRDPETRPGLQRSRTTTRRRTRRQHRHITLPFTFNCNAGVRTAIGDR